GKPAGKLRRPCQKKASLPKFAGPLCPKKASPPENSGGLAPGVDRGSTNSGNLATTGATFRYGALLLRALLGGGRL
ncbi:MAG: hypothetical protein LBD89_02290, partial [Tannerellaceae bacterium]|nr:hypothetical protein [Tannerellaceae bacterium]